MVRIFADSPLGDWATLRIALSSLLLSFFWSFFCHFFPKIVGRILAIVYVLVYGIYSFVEFGLYNYLGFFMGVGNSEQGTKVLGYINDFIKSLSWNHWLLLLPTLIALIYFIVIDRIILKNKQRNKEFNKIQLTYIEVVCAIAIIGFSGLYYLTIKSDKMQNELQASSNYSLWIYPENSNLTVNNFGVFMYGVIDIKSILLNASAEDAIDLDDLNTNNNHEEEIITDYSRVIDDSAWQMLIENTDKKSYNTLNNYFINRSITQKNEYTGIFEGKNLIIILMESVNEISILNEEDFPTLTKLYNEGISFRNNFTPRNNCSTGNNEFTVLTSLFTINNTCTANTYASNKYFEAAYNIFNNAGYYTSSYHDYTQQYYRRNKIHTNLGSQKYYGVTDLDIPYSEKYEEWPSDVELFKQSQKYYMDKDKFFSYFATVTPHQTYHVSSEMGDKYTYLWDDTDYSMRLKRYLSKLKTLDEALAELLHELEESGKLEDTVIALFGDHFPYGLQDKDINQYLESNGADYTVNRNSTKNKDVDRTPMIIYNAGMEPVVVEEYTSVIDLLPTLLNMFNMDYDPRLYLGHDIFSDDYTSRVVFADGSWQDELGFYYAPSSKINYFDETKTYTTEELKSINSEILERQKMSTTAIKENYFKYLGDGLTKYQDIIDKEKEEKTATATTTESEEDT